MEFVTYKGFGAVGDGVANDLFAMRRAHEYANENGLPVKADEGATFLIREFDGNPIIIKTDTDWSGAHLIFDDREATYENPADKACLFEIASDFDFVDIDESYVSKINALGGLIPEKTLSIETGLSHAAMLWLKNDDHKFFIRYGGDANNGSGQIELTMVDENGTVDTRVPIMHTFEHLTGIRARRCDDKPITLTGGRVTTLATAALVDRIAYIHRGIVVSRSNTTVRGLIHEIVGEPDYPCASYNGILSIRNSANVLVEDCTFQSRKYYNLCGSYDIGAGQALNITFRNCTQSNFFSDDGTKPRTGYWGVMGSNFCKNMVYDGCRLSRYDAHCGTYGGKIINSEITSLTLIGAGDFLLENTHIYSWNCPLTLRADYGSTWRGHITIKDCTLHNVSRDLVFVAGMHWANHYFGYRTYMPSITVDNLTVENPPDEIMMIRSIDAEKYNFRSIFRTPHLAVMPSGEKNENPIVPPERLIVKNNKAGYRFTLVDAPVFENTYTEGLEIVPWSEEYCHK